MKKSIILIVAALVLIVTVAATFSQLKASDKISNQPFEIGRFVLFQGNYVVVNGEQHWNELGVFKIDTITGKTWKYSTGMSDGKFYEKWCLTQE